MLTQAELLLFSMPNPGEIEKVPRPNSETIPTIVSSLDFLIVARIHVDVQQSLGLIVGRSKDEEQTVPCQGHFGVSRQCWICPD